jgi:hypothetical protein
MMVIRDSWKEKEMKKLVYLIMALVLALGLTLPVASTALANDAGFKFPTSYATGSTGNPPWFPEAALVDDLAPGQTDPGVFGQPRTAVFSQDGSRSEFYYDFGFGIPSGATIDGIEVVVSGYCEASEGEWSPITFGIGLSGDTGVSWTGYQETSPRLVYTDTEYTLGGPADLWGKDWNAGSFSDGNFRLEVVATHHGHSDIVALDSVRVKVYYTPSTTYGFNGLLPPYLAPPKAFKAGSSIPLKWQYTNTTGTAVDSPAAAPVVKIQPAGQGGQPDGDPITLNDPGSSGLRYDTLTYTWQWNWQTKGLSAGLYNIYIYCGQTGQTQGPFPIQLK